MSKRRTFPKSLLAFSIAGTTFLLITLSYISIKYTNRMVSHYSHLVATSIEVKQEATIAHLWFEEILSGDRNESMDDVWEHLANSDLHAQHILNILDEPQGDVFPLNNLYTRQLIKSVRNKLTLFRDITQERLETKLFSGVGTAIDQKYDAVFLDLIADMNQVMASLKVSRSNDLKRFNTIQSALILLILFSGLIAGLLVFVYQRHLNILLDQQLIANQDLIDSQTRLQDIADCAGDWVWEIDSMGRYTYISNNIVDILGYPAEELLGCTPFILMSKEETDRIGNIFWEVFNKHEKISDLDNWNLHKSGKLIYFRINAIPLFDRQRKFKGYRGVDKDITEYKAMNDLLLRSQKMDALGKLTGGIAHDFNNMLGVILGYSELLISRASDDKDQEKYAKEIYRAGQRAEKLTSKLLAFSRHKILSTEPTNINQILKDDQHMLEKTLTPRIKLVYDLEESLWITNIHKSSLEDSILNMCINSMHAINDSGSLIITTRNISMELDDARNLDLKPGNYVALALTDTGTGMDQETQQKIFDPFFTTKGETGTGLGMSQVYGFVQQSNGAIDVSSLSGHGTQIVIYLPQITNEIPVEHTPDNQDSDRKLSGDETVLVVDDEKGLRELAKEILMTYGYKVLCAENGHQALDILQNNQVDLLLSDVIMPGIDGYELAAKVSTIYPNIIIQMASGFSDFTHVNKLNHRLHLKRLQKPYTSNTLVQRIRTLLDNRNIL